MPFMPGSLLFLFAEEFLLALWRSRFKSVHAQVLRILTFLLFKVGCQRMCMMVKECVLGLQSAKATKSLVPSDSSHHISRS
jgi:hypothetical protein